MIAAATITPALLTLIIILAIVAGACLSKIFVSRRQDLSAKIIKSLEQNLVWIDQFHGHGHFEVKFTPESLEEIIDALNALRGIPPGHGPQAST